MGALPPSVHGAKTGQLMAWANRRTPRTAAYRLPDRTAQASTRQRKSKLLARTGPTSAPTGGGLASGNFAGRMPNTRVGAAACHATPQHNDACYDTMRRRACDPKRPRSRHAGRPCLTFVARRVAGHPTPQERHRHRLSRAMGASLSCGRLSLKDRAQAQGPTLPCGRWTPDDRTEHVCLTASG